MGALHSVVVVKFRTFRTKKLLPFARSTSRYLEQEGCKLTLSPISSTSTLVAESRQSFSGSDAALSPSEEECELGSLIEAVTNAKPRVECLLRCSSAGVWRAGEYEYVRTLQFAEANHGHVDLMRSLTRGGVMVAVKVMPKSWVGGSHEEFMRNNSKTKEFPWLDICIVRFLEEQHFPHICKPYGVYTADFSTLVVTEFGTQGDLFGLVGTFGPVGCEREAAAQPLARQIVDMVRQLHDLGISHGDLSPENIVVSIDGEGTLRPKLIDFGMATFDRYRVGTHGKSACLAPEAYGRSPHDTFLSDAFSLGVIIFAMVAQDYPWSSTRPGKCKAYGFVQARGFRAFCKQRRAFDDPSKCLMKALSPDVIDVVEGLIALQPKSRFHLGEGCWELEAPHCPGSVASCPWFQTDKGQ